ncbi:MAG: hypothetical protein LBB45_09070 [Methanobrevibacter sp.]|jgi:hypothetical protein|nr:hypothetical protein [Candidatus Methanovirga basalitermitum]
MNDLMTKQKGSIGLHEKAIGDYIYGEFYNLNNKKTPDSRIIQSMANKLKIRTEIVEAIQTEEYAKVIAKARHKTNSSEGVVIHHFNTVRDDKIVSMYEREQDLFKEYRSRPMNKEKQYKPVYFMDIDQPFIINENGSMIPNLTIKGQLKIVKDMVRFKTFAVRDATTKAMNIAQRKILNQDWREQEEVQMEESDIKKVNDDKKFIKEKVEPKEDNQDNSTEPDGKPEFEGEPAEKKDRPSMTSFDHDPDLLGFNQESLDIILNTPVLSMAYDQLNKDNQEINKKNMVTEISNMVGEGLITPDESQTNREIIMGLKYEE